MKNRIRTCICRALDTSWIYRSRMGIIFLRICVGVMMLAHGAPKLVLLLRGEGSGWMDPLGIGGTASLALCVFAEFFCSLALIVGFCTRLSAAVLFINFWVVVFVVHMLSGGAQAELPLLYLVCYGTLMCTGAGAFSVDTMLKKRLYQHYCPPAGRSSAGCGGAASAAASAVSTK